MRKKKALTWHSTYGDIGVVEQVLREGRRGPQVRSFSARAGVSHRSYSQPLQRRLVDFGAEVSFAQAVERLREHYGVDLPASRLRALTLEHARAAGAVAHRPEPAVPVLITGLDGSMVPIMEPGEGPDRRKGKTLHWKQANLCFARGKDVVDAVYGATLGTVKMAGLVWSAVARAAGQTDTTYVHAVADGSDPIYETFQTEFGTDETRAKFHVDLWHVEEYLGAAGDVVAPGEKTAWLHTQHDRLLANQAATVLATLVPQLEPAEQEAAPVRAAHRYIQARVGQMDYAGARAAGLPVGSGENESGHRHVVQARLKKAGTWWRYPNAQAMLQLRTLRANRDWPRYWTEFAQN